MTDTRSRNGCLVCRKRRRKCDEARPSCGGCVKRRLTCDYQLRVRWSATSGLSMAKKRKGITESRAAQHERKNSVSGSDESTCNHPEGSFHIPELPIEQTMSSGLVIANKGPEEVGENSDDGSDQSEEAWEVNDEFEGQIDPSIFPTPGEHIAFVYYIRYLSGVLPALDSSSNPYRRLSKLALASPVLLNTIISLSTEYMFLNGRVAPEITLQRHHQAIQSLREALVSASAPHPHGSPAFGDSGNEIGSKEATLAAVLFQVANVVFTGGIGVEVHLACAMHFIHDLDYLSAPVDGFLPRLLVQRFAMLDVVTAIQRFRRPQLRHDFWFFEPNDYYDRTEPSFREMTGCPQPVLGYFARIANLQADLLENCKSEYNILVKASTLETDMRIYARSRVAFSSTRSVEANHLDSLSQCFYWSAHLLLQRRIYRDASTSHRVQQTAANIVKLIKSMPLGCGPDSSLLFPFYLSSKEAITDEHRQWVRQRNEEMKEIYSARSRDTVMSLLDEVWAAVDDQAMQAQAMSNEIDSKVHQLECSREICLF